MKRKDVFKFLLVIFWVFIIGSIIGYIVETIVAIVKMAILCLEKV